MPGPRFNFGDGWDLLYTNLCRMQGKVFIGTFHISPFTCPCGDDFFKELRHGSFYVYESH